MPVPEAWPVEYAYGTNAYGQGLPWREYFIDPALQRLIETALSNNRDLRRAALNVEAARAAFRIQRGRQFPEIDVAAQGARARVPGDLSITGQPAIGAEYRAEVGITAWELDLWGRVRSLKDAALEQWLASDAGRRAVELSLIARVADSWLVLSELDERVALAQRTLETREEFNRIFSRRYEVGAASKLELTEVRTLLTQAQTLLVQLEQARASQRWILWQLVGAEPDAPSASMFDQMAPFAALSLGMPSDLLTGRPDIVAAEHRLRAAHADIGAARAAFFPRIALTGSFGTASVDLAGLFAPGSRAWTFAPTLSVPIFDGGALRASLDLSEVRRDIAVAEYEQVIQTAFREVADALAARHWLAEQVDIRHVAFEAQTERARLAQLRYDHGSAAYLEVLDAQRDLFDAEQQLVQAKRALLSSQVALYAALGGGNTLTPAH